VEPSLWRQDVTVHVRLLDVSCVDAPSETVAAETLHGVSLDGREVKASSAFALVAEVATDRSYTLTAHVDVNGTGKVECGDYLTTESVPVKSTLADASFEIPVRLVAS